MPGMYIPRSAALGMPGALRELGSRQEARVCTSYLLIVERFPCTCDRRVPHTLAAIARPWIYLLDVPGYLLDAAGTSDARGRRVHDGWVRLMDHSAGERGTSVTPPVTAM